MLRNIGITVASILVGTILSALMAGTLNGHGPDAGFLGMFLVVIVGPGLAAISAVAALITNGHKASLYCSAVTVGAIAFTVTAFMHSH